MDTLADMASERKALRFELDALSDIVVNASSVSFRHDIRTLRAHETFCETPRDVMERTASLLDADIIDGVARTVHDTVTVAIGCNRVPLFALVEGGRARTLFTFRCVYDGCPAFMDIRTFVGQWRVKWIIVCISHTHSFDVFPARMPRSTFPDGAVRLINNKAAENKTTAEIRKELDILCNKDVFQNTIRKTRALSKEDQARRLRDTADESQLCSSDIRLTMENVFYEAFFINTKLVGAGLGVDFVFMDDTSCTNAFCLPIVALVCRDASRSLHVLAWGITKNRTTSAFVRFLSFVSSVCPSIKVFMCDRHYAQRQAILTVFGPSTRLRCCVHKAHNIQQNFRPNGRLLPAFWNVGRSLRPDADEAFFVELGQLHAAKRSSFSKQLLVSRDVFLQSRIDPLLKRDALLFFARLRSIIKSFTVDTIDKEKAVDIVRVLKEVILEDADVFSLDNANSVEGFFRVIKRRLTTTTPTLFKVFEAIDFTERYVMAHHNPASQALLHPISLFIIKVVRRDVLNVMTLCCV